MNAMNANHTSKADFLSGAAAVRAPWWSVRALSVVVGAWLALAPGCGNKSGDQRTLGGGQGGQGGRGDRQTEEVPTLVRVSARGADADQAHARALEALEQKLLGERDVSLSQIAGIPSWAPGVDLRSREDDAGGGVTITLGLSRERVAEFLDAMRDHPWQVSAPEALAGVLAAAVRVRVENLVCERRRVLLDDQACAASDMQDAVASVRTLAESVRLRSYYKDGVPVAGDGRLLRPLSVVVEMRSDKGWMPLAGVPVVAARQPDALRGQSEDSGLVFLAAPGDQTAFAEGRAHVAVDRESLLGPLYEIWPESWVEVPLRPVSRARFTLIGIERVRGKDVDDAVFAGALARVSQAKGRASPVKIKPVIASLLASMPADQLTAKLPQYADIWEGFLDVVVRVEVESDYASRMGAHRMWYEARARVAVFDAWTGQLLETFEESVTASGVGEERADQAARELLAEPISDKLFGAR